MKISLTPGEREILLDRPEDCVAQSLADTEDLGITEAQAESAFPTVTAMVLSGEVNSTNLDRVGLEVLADMAEGSTFFADWQDRPDSARFRALLKSAASLETKLSALLGRRVKIPTW
jgi:hypothetical protein